MKQTMRSKWQVTYPQERENKGGGEELGEGDWGGPSWESQSPL